MRKGSPVRKPAEEPVGGVSPFAFHMGSTLLDVAATYGNIFLAVLEYIQNAIDKEATQIQVYIDYRKRTLAVRDNGHGVDKEEFDKALLSVNHTIKKGDRYGRYGKGLVSMIGKCKRMLFSSTSESDPHAYKAWEFVTAVLADQHTIEGIPWRPRPELWFGREDNKIWWRTENRAEEFTSDSQLSAVNFNTLRDETVMRYGQMMRENNIVVMVTTIDAKGNRKTDSFKAPDHEGTPLPEYSITNELCGKTVFRLYISRPDKKRKVRGEVGIGISSDPFRLRFKVFVESLPESFRKEFSDAAQALLSGLFEGEIVNDQITRLKDRTNFLVDDSLAAFCGALAEWFSKIGREHYENLQDERENLQYQDWGRRSMAAFEALILGPAGAALKNIIKSVFTHGTIDPASHTKKKSKEITDLRQIRTLLELESEEDKDLGRHDTGKRTDPKFEKKDDTPLTVAGPRGKRRTVVRNNSLGFGLVHDVLPDTRMWELDSRQGVLFINIRHPLWVACKAKGADAAMRFQEYLMTAAFTVWGAPEELREHVRLQLEQQAVWMSFLAANGDNLAGRSLASRRKAAAEARRKARETPSLDL